MFRERSFRINLPAFGLFMLAVGLCGVEVPRLAGFVHEPLTHFGPYEGTLIGSMGLLALAVWGLFPEHAGPDGLRGTDGIGRYHDVRWEEIEGVSTLLGFMWIRHGKPGKALTIPKFLGDSFGFREYVRRNAPEGNPLRTYLNLR